MRKFLRTLGRGPVLDGDQHADRAGLLARTDFELVPTKNVSAAIHELPPDSSVTVTCSPVKGIDATLDLTETLEARRHRVTPHLAARMVESFDHLDRIVARLAALHTTKVFVVAGDATDARGPFEGATELIDELLNRCPSLTDVGFAGYPDGHHFIEPDVAHASLHAKQRLVHEAGVAGHVATQMCFDADAIRRWVTTERAAGLEVPVHLGAAGVVDRARLVAMGMRLGVGPSLRYLSKNRSALTRLMTASSYSPGDVVDQLAGDLGSLGIERLHLFTFNQVAATRTWLESQT